MEDDSLYLEKQIVQYLCIAGDHLASAVEKLERLHELRMGMGRRQQSLFQEDGRGDGSIHQDVRPTIGDL